MIETIDVKDFINLNHKYFSYIIEADSNPYIISSKETYKINGEIKFKLTKEEVLLEQISSIDELIINNKNIEEIDYYPKTFFRKLFNIKSSVNLSYTGEDNEFVMMSKNTQKIFNTNCTVYDIEEDNKIIIGKRGRLVFRFDDEKIFASFDKKNYKTIILK